jgi:1,4-dihydroxy-2-naphthoate octaprenyltransferase
VPVVVGTAVAGAQGSVVWWRAAVTMVVALALQVGVNYANDYSDGVRGTDDARVGPTRLVASGLAAPRLVKGAAFAAFGVAGAAGVVLAAVAGWQLLVVGAAAIAAAWFYTGGPHPYGYAGLGELFVFVFFGVVATAGTAYVQTERLTALALVASVPVGLLAVALLVVNNLRDREGDAAAGKRTLAVRLGDRRTRRLYRACVLVPFPLLAVVAAWRAWALIAVLALPLAVSAADRVRRGAAGPELIEVLGATGRLQMAFGALLTVGIAVAVIT